MTTQFTTVWNPNQSSNPYEIGVEIIDKATAMIHCKGLSKYVKMDLDNCRIDRAKVDIPFNGGMFVYNGKTEELLVSS